MKIMKCSPQIINRIKRVNGQISGILKMIEQERGCKDLITQLKAAKNSLKKTIRLLAETNLLDSIEEKHNLELINLEKQIDLIVRN
ncbi:MAG: metal-sensing transcriptional repressor [Acholeplasmataceae bacterium]|nr:metal-sensing transcriptional repressor [Acholeplasmataceae bacterium]